MDLPAGTGRQNFHHIKTDVGISIRALLKILARHGNQTLLFIIVHRFGWGGALALVRVLTSANTMVSALYKIKSSSPIRCGSYGSAAGSPAGCNT